MKKSDLIKLLNSVPGDPDIKLWNGYAQDWMDISRDVVPQELVKRTKADWLEGCRLERCWDRKDHTYQLQEEEVRRLSANYSRIHPWEINPFVTQEDISQGRYETKLVYVLQAKIKGVETFDRAGKNSY